MLDDLINLQQSNLEKAKGFFSYHGWKWHSTDKDVHAFTRRGYELNFDRIMWKLNTEEVKFLQYRGSENIIIYVTDIANFKKIENEIKGQTKQVSSATNENQLSTTYKKGELEIVFSQRKIKEWFSDRTIYELYVLNGADVDKRINLYCSRCKGVGQITENQTCNYCSGKGKSKCNLCIGEGSIYCMHCKQGNVDCNQCWGAGSHQCNRCFGQGNIQCSKCLGQGKITYCSNCNGRGVVNKDVGFGSVRFGNYTQTCNVCNGKGTGDFTCKNCSGKGRIKCEHCEEKGKTTCNGCIGAGKKQCNHCNGDYETSCNRCSRSGFTGTTCGFCSGKGTTHNTIRRVCPECNGAKLKNN